MLRLRSGTVAIIGGSRLLGGALRSPETSFLCDCKDLERSIPAPDPAPPSRDRDTDGILAASFSSSGRYFALTDDRKRLVLFRTAPTWERLSVRWVSRRCTSLTFSACESFILVADKSGDVFSFSVTNAQEEEGRLELGHLSMLLDLVVTPDGRYVITGDRDEKIRVSLWEAPHVISAFCLGHTEFVSQLLVPPTPSNVLLSGSGDGTVRVWRYESGEEITSWNLKDVLRPGEDNETQRFAVSRMICAPGGEHLAVLCDGVRGVFLVSMSGAPSLTHPQYIALPYVPVDLDFEDSSSLWVLSGVKEKPIELLRYDDGAWQPAPQRDDIQRLSEMIQENWEQLDGVASPENRFSGLYKVVFDNMSSYLMKKEARLQAEKRKVSSTQTSAAVKVQKT